MNSFKNCGGFGGDTTTVDDRRRTCVGIMTAHPSSRGIIYSVINYVITIYIFLLDTRADNHNVLLYLILYYYNDTRQIKRYSFRGKKKKILITEFRKTRL